MYFPLLVHHLLWNWLQASSFYWCRDEQLRRISRNSGVQLSVGAQNARDSLYRSSVHYAINACCMYESYSLVGMIDWFLYFQCTAQFLWYLWYSVVLQVWKSCSNRWWRSTTFFSWASICSWCHCSSCRNNCLCCCCCTDTALVSAGLGKVWLIMTQLSDNL